MCEGSYKPENHRYDAQQMRHDSCQTRKMSGTDSPNSKKRPQQIISKNLTEILEFWPDTSYCAYLLIRQNTRNTPIKWQGFSYVNSNDW